MRGFINHAETAVEEMVNGYLRVYPGRFVKVKGKNQRLNGFIRQNCSRKVSVITGGGAGNEPWSVGFVGDGLADGAVMGAVFTAPPARFIVNVTQALPTDQGALYICTNHAGDVLNYELAGELAQLENIETRCIKVSDDISGLMGERKEERRGQAGVAFVIKIAGAASEAGYSLAETARVAQKANERVTTFGAAVSSGYIPGSGELVHRMQEGQVEYGKGFNGENGVLVEQNRSADEIVDTMMSYLLREAKLTSLDEVALLINAYGMTSTMEQCIIARKAVDILSAQSIQIHHIIMDRLFQPLSGGCSISILRLDEELKRLYDMPASSPMIKCWQN